jgi:hypothetical protein
MESETDNGARGDNAFYQFEAIETAAGRIGASGSPMALFARDRVPVASQDGSPGKLAELTTPATRATTRE